MQLILRESPITGIEHLSSLLYTYASALAIEDGNDMTSRVAILTVESASVVPASPKPLSLDRVLSLTNQSFRALQ